MSVCVTVSCSGITNVDGGAAPLSAAGVGAPDTGLASSVIDN